MLLDLVDFFVDGLKVHTLFESLFFLELFHKSAIHPNHQGLSKLLVVLLIERKRIVLLLDVLVTAIERRLVCVHVARRLDQVTQYDPSSGSLGSPFPRKLAPLKYDVRCRPRRHIGEEHWIFAVFVPVEETPHPATVPMQIKNEFDRLLFAKLADVLLDGVHLWLSDGVGSQPATVEVIARVVTPVVPEIHPVHVDHGNDVEVETPQQKLSLFTVPQQIQQYFLSDVRAGSLSRVLSTHHHNRPLIFGVIA